jgi:hypothetical protein
MRLPTSEFTCRTAALVSLSAGVALPCACMSSTSGTSVHLTQIQFVSPVRWQSSRPMLIIQTIHDSAEFLYGFSGKKMTKIYAVCDIDERRTP